MNLEIIERLVKVQTELSNNHNKLIQSNKKYGSYIPTSKLEELLEQTAIKIQTELTKE